jgi:predicted Co/Zn/Cd cation transporter (cation efflux family)
LSSRNVLPVYLNPEAENKRDAATCRNIYSVSVGQNKDWRPLAGFAFTFLLGIALLFIKILRITGVVLMLSAVASAVIYVLADLLSGGSVITISYALCAPLFASSNGHASAYLQGSGVC